MKEKYAPAPWHALEENYGFIKIKDKDERFIAQILSGGPKAKKLVVGRRQQK